LKSEGRNPKEIRRPNGSSRLGDGGGSDFGFRNSFGLRISFDSSSAGPREFEGNGGASAHAAFHPALAADFGHAFAHVAQAVRPRVLGVVLKSFSVVLDDHAQ